MPALTSQQARTIIDAAFAAARKASFKPMGVVVIDASAQVVASAREDGASALRLDIALGKAGAAVGMGCNSRALVQRAKDMPAFFGAVSAVAQQKFIPQTGAVLICAASCRKRIGWAIVFLAAGEASLFGGSMAAFRYQALLIDPVLPGLGLASVLAAASRVACSCSCSR